jgi:Chlorophyllase enzyme
MRSILALAALANGAFAQASTPAAASPSSNAVGPSSPSPASVSPPNAAPPAVAPPANVAPVPVPPLGNVAPVPAPPPAGPPPQVAPPAVVIPNPTVAPPTIVLNPNDDDEDDDDDASQTTIIPAVPGQAVTIVPGQAPAEVTIVPAPTVTVVSLPPPPPLPKPWLEVANPGPGVVPPADVVLPNLGVESLRFPPGPEANSAKLAFQGRPGEFSIALIDNDPAFPNRTIYVPQGVPAGRPVPIIAWENGQCRKYGRMYQGFLQELASHGYLVVAPGPANALAWGRTDADSQANSVAMARAWTSAPFNLDKTKVAIAGHSCGGQETLRNLARADPGQYTTGILLNSAGWKHTLDRVHTPMLWINGGKTDVQKAQQRNFDHVADWNSDLPVAMVGLQTGHLGSFWTPRGGIYAETLLHWLNWQLRGNLEGKAWFSGTDVSPAYARGWEIQTNHVAE